MLEPQQDSHETSTYLIFFFVGVKGNVEDITIFFTNTMRCLQSSVRECDSMGHDSMIWKDSSVSLMDTHGQFFSSCQIASG